MRNLIYLTFALFLISCNEQPNKSTEEKASNPTREDGVESGGIAEKTNGITFDKFKSYFRNNRSLPVEIDACNVRIKGLVEFREAPDFGEGLDNTFCYGNLPPNGKYHAVLSLGQADCLLPIITTFNQEGKIIDQKTIGIGYCGHDPCFSCDEYMIIRKDYSLYTSDTITTTECDEDFNPIPNTKKIKVIYKEGKLNKDGTIELSEEKEVIVLDETKN